MMGYIYIYIYYIEKMFHYISEHSNTLRVIMEWENFNKIIPYATVSEYQLFIDTYRDLLLKMMVNLNNDWYDMMYAVFRETFPDMPNYIYLLIKDPEYVDKLMSNLIILNKWINDPPKLQMTWDEFITGTLFQIQIQDTIFGIESEIISIAETLIDYDTVYMVIEYELDANIYDLSFLMDYIMDINISSIIVINDTYGTIKRIINLNHESMNNSKDIDIQNTLLLRSLELVTGHVTIHISYIIQSLENKFESLTL